jgi:hypothetical protein
MSFLDNKFVQLGFGVAGAIFPQIALIEQIASAIPGLHGKAKQDAVVALVKKSVEAWEQTIGRDVVNDPEVEKATRGVIDAVVALQNLVVRKAEEAAAARG